MINLVKSLIPNSFIAVGYTLDLLSKGIGWLSTGTTHIGVKLHILFKTKLGVRFKELETAVQAAVQQIVAMQKHIEQQKAANRNDSAKLANLVKGETKPPVKLVTLGKKSDDESQG